MIELKDGLIGGKHAPKETINFSFSSGQINHISFDEKYIYYFLRVKDQSLKSGEFLIDGDKIFPEEENQQKSLFVMAVNSLIKFILCFAVDANEKDKKVKSVQEQLLALKEMPINSDFEKNAKIAAIFDTITNLNPSYVLFDFNEECNQHNQELSKGIDRIYATIPVIVLDEKPLGADDPDTIEYDEIVDLSIGENTTAKYIKVEKVGGEFVLFDDNNVGRDFSKLMSTTFKKNAMVFASFLVPTLGTIAFLLLTPLYLKTSSKFLAVPFIIAIIACLAIYMLMTYRITEFAQDYKRNMKKILAYFTINSIVTIVGVGMGVGVYFLFKNFDPELKVLSGNTTGILLAVIFALLLLTANLFVRPLVTQIIKLIRRNK